MNNDERGNAHDGNGATVSTGAAIVERALARGNYTARCYSLYPDQMPRYNALRAHQVRLENAPRWVPWRNRVAARIQREIEALPRFYAWSDTFPNVVTTVGGNDILDKYLAGSGYTGAFYLGAISAVSYTGVPVIADTMASHGTWTEAGGTNAPAYSQTTRGAASWSAASAKVKAMASAVVLSITSAGTLKGSFLTTVSTKDGTTGVLVSAGLFTGGDKIVGIGDTVNISYSLGL
jgi:hypothetical protein